jgi:DNA-binding NtrC family response regulator
MMPAILVIEDETRLAKNIDTYLSRSGFDVRRSESGSQGLEEFNRFKPDVVLLDFKLPDLDGIEVLRRLRNFDPEVKVVMMTGAGGVEIAVTAMKAGAHDYLAKPLALKELKLLLEKAIGQERLEGKLSYYQRKEAERSGLSKLLGDSPGMRALKHKVRQIVEADGALSEGTPASVLITGQTGTGKELVARAIHFDGPRHKQAFVELNCAAIPGHLMESELFGYERGAFTDARTRKLGLVEAANGGTLFLDEIGDMEPEVQAKLLKLLEDKVVRRLGGLRDRKMDVRIITATNQPLEQQVHESKFRPDLYYRLRVLQVDVPPLNERKDDILLLADHFLRLFCGRYGKTTLSLGSDAKRALVRHSWPGNVRELRNTMEQAVLLSQDSLLGPENIFLPSEMPGPSTSAVAEAGSEPFTLPETGVDLGELERQLVEQALDRTQGNVTKAADLLGLSRDTLRYRMQKFGLP